MKSFVYSGKLYRDDYDCLAIDDGNYLIELISSDFKKGDKILVRYYVTDKPVSINDVNIKLFNSISGIIDDLDFTLDAYSEWTIMDYNESFVIGGHDMFDELLGYEDKYIIMVIDKFGD